MRMSLPGFWPRPRRGWPLYRTPSVSWRISYWPDPSTGWWVFLEGNHGWKWLLGEKKSVIKYDNFKKKGKEILLYIRVFFTNFERKKLPSSHFFTILCDKCCLHELTNTLIIHFFCFHALEFYRLSLSIPKFTWFHTFPQGILVDWFSLKRNKRSPCFLSLLVCHHLCCWVSMHSSLR